MDLERSALWAGKRGKFSQLSFVFSEAEWREIGKMPWGLIMLREKESKQVTVLRAIWKVVNTFGSLSAEGKAAQAEIQAFERVAVGAKELQKSSKVPRFFGISCTHTVTTWQEVKQSVSEPGRSRATEVSPSTVREIVSEREVPQLPDPGGVVEDEEAGGAEGREGLAQEMEQRGGDQSWDTGGAARAPSTPGDGVMTQGHLAHVMKATMAAPTATTAAQDTVPPGAASVQPARAQPAAPPPPPQRRLRAARCPPHRRYQNQRATAPTPSAARRAPKPPALCPAWPAPPPALPGGLCPRSAGCPSLMLPSPGHPVMGATEPMSCMAVTSNPFCP